MKYVVEIVRRSNEETVRRIDCGASERKAGRVDDGVNINLNHAEFYTKIVELEDSE